MATQYTYAKDQLDKKFNRAIENAMDILTKRYLDNLEDYDIVRPSVEDEDIDIVQCGKLFKLTKLIYNKEENFIDKLTTVVNVASAVGCSLATIIHSDGIKIDYYFGMISKNHRLNNELHRKRRDANVKAFKGALSGNLQGSELIELSEDDMENLKKDIFSNENCYSSISGIVALRDEDEKSVETYVQGIENLVDSLKGNSYTLVMFADPITSNEIQVVKQGYEMLHTELKTLQKKVITYNESDTTSESNARTNGLTDGITKGIALAQSITDTKSKSKTISGNIGVSIPLEVVSINGGVSASKTVGTSHAETSGRTDNAGYSVQNTNSDTRTTSDSKTDGRSLQLEYENRSVKTLMDKADKHLERLDECDSFGAFNCAAYVIASDRETALTVASNYNALMRGKDSNVQSSHINLWYKPEDTRIIGKYLKAFVHPKFTKKEDGENVVVTPASIISGNELAIQIGLPKKSVNGVTVIPMAPFGRNIIEPDEKSKMCLGNLYHMGKDEGVNGSNQKVNINIESLSMHTFITGSTGAGKSTAIYSLLDKLMNQPVKNRENEKIKFMVIEPAKGEYKDRFGNYDNVKVYGTNSKKMPLLRINPFSFPEDVHILEHIDRLIEIFNVCWPMYAAMPAVLKDSIERAYIASGWNLDSSECKYKDIAGVNVFPTFVDILKQINVVMEESQYSNDSKGDYKGALCTRIKSLTNGLYGQIFTCDELNAKDLFDENVIVDLSRTGSSETKSLIMGLLVMKLQEYRMSCVDGSNQPLKHVTVLEEAHNLLKKTSSEQSADSANLAGKSVEMLANSIAEMRTYGEGFIIADQAPGLMDMSVIRNTNTKIILRLPDLSDRELVGKAAGLNDDQIVELSKLKTFVAAVYQNNWLEPVLCNIETNFVDSKPYEYKKVSDEKTSSKKEYVEILIMKPDDRRKLDKTYVDNLIKNIWKLNIPVESKLGFVRYIGNFKKNEISAMRGSILFNLFNSEMAFGLVKDKEKNVDVWCNAMKDVLEPCLSTFDENVQKAILVMLVQEQCEKGLQSKEFFERVAGKL